MNTFALLFPAEHLMILSMIRYNIKIQWIEEFGDVEELGFINAIISTALIFGMESEMDYKEIFKLAKERVVIFSELIGKSPIDEVLKLESKS